MFLQHFCTQLSPFVRNYLIGITVTHEYGCIPVWVVCRDQVLDLLLQEQIATQTEDASKLTLICDPGEDRHGSTLREASYNYAICGYALSNFFVDEGVKVFLGVDDAFLVFCTIVQGAERLDIIPPWHAHAHILSHVSASASVSMHLIRSVVTHEGRRWWTNQGDWDVWRIREDK